jgi:GT2 family glycosyltransferase
MQPITFVTATRLSEADFHAKSALGRSLQVFKGAPIRLRLFANNSHGLSACYNQAITELESAADVLVFVHDDVLIPEFFWIEKLLWGFENFQVLGVAGNKQRAPRQPSWAFIDSAGTWDVRANLSGVIGHGGGFPCELNFYGPPAQECRLLDGVLLAARKSTFDKTGIRFDERFDFHFYDLDFCRQCEAQRVRMGTIPLSIIHGSGGSVFGSASWQENYKKYLDKWVD